MYQNDDVEKAITWFIDLPEYEQINMWKTHKFACLFPKMIRHIFSPEIFNLYDDSVREKIYNGTLAAFETLSGDTMEERTPLEKILGTRFYHYNLETETATRTGIQSGKGKTVPLYYICLAGILLLGMSLPESDIVIPLQDIIQTFTCSTETEKDRFLFLCGLFLNKDSEVRIWIKKHKFEEVVRRNWDKTLAELIVNSPQYRPDPYKLTPKKLPSEMTMTDTYRMYSTDAYEIFVDYALTITFLGIDPDFLVEGRKIVRKLIPGLLMFQDNIRRFPKELRESFLAKEAIQMIKIAQKAYEVGDGAMPNANELLPSRKGRQPGRLRHYFDPIKRPGYGMLS